ncbi:hypothetical protein [Flavitalea sp.]
MKNNYASYQFRMVVVTDNDFPHLEIWDRKNPDLVQHVPLIRIKSNLPCNSGYHYFFICPETSRMCKKLHLHDGKFIHRLGIDGGTYTYLGLSLISKIRYTQIKNHKKSSLLLLEKSKPFYKSHYQGQPTKKETEVKKACEHLQMVRRIYSKQLN